jgi:AGZA family xanthine/uracil permease-like MFS transporter
MTMTKDHWTDVIAGISVFLSMSYVAFANPLLLATADKSGHGMPNAGVFVATCVIAAIATFFSGRYSGSPAALAPGLALSIVIEKFLTSSETTIKWESALIVSFAAGVALLLLSIGMSSPRRSMIDAIPPIIKKAIMAGIGSVLAKTAIDFIQYFPFANASDCAAHTCIPQPGLGTIFFAVGMFIILLGYFGLRGWAAVRKDSYANVLDISGRVSFVISILVVAALVNNFDPEAITPVASGASALWPWLDSTQTFTQAMRGAVRLESVALFVIILYILIVDIVGSPYHLASSDRNTYDAAKFDDDEENRIKRSFYVDSAANIVAAIVGSTPVVYYAENFAGRVLGGRRPLVAYTVAAGFIVLLLIGLGFWAGGWTLSSFVPQIAIAPVLFVVGLIIMSEALREGKKSSAASVSQDVTNASGAVSRSDLAELVPRIPAPLAVVVTPLAGFETGIAAGIIFYVTFVQWLGDEQADLHDKSRTGWLATLTFVAIFSVFVRAKLYFGF